jgi:NAD(P)-dependent dehydrogenase (short-subunit alcohol dehydrogenase family)
MDIGSRRAINQEAEQFRATIVATGIHLPLGLQETAEQVVSAAIHNFGRVDLLVNNAGVFIPKPFTGYTVEDFRKATATNLSGFSMCHSSQ